MKDPHSLGQTFHRNFHISSDPRDTGMSATAAAGSDDEKFLIPRGKLPDHHDFLFAGPLKAVEEIIWSVKK